MNCKTRAILLTNLGTPEQPTAKSVAAFLKKFLSDPRVVEAPKAIWWIVLRFIIIPLRAKRVAAAYKKIWSDLGSPLKVISSLQVDKLQKLLDENSKAEKSVVIAVETYGKKPLSTHIQELTEQCIESFIVVPMYPQYSGSTTGAIYDQLAKITMGSRNVPDVRVIKSYCKEAGYISSLAESVLDSWREKGRSEKLLMSFHGVPKAYVEKGDPYYDHCVATATALAEKLGLTPDEWAFSFQSRFGPKEWIQPYTDELLTEWAGCGIKSVDVISPAFTADCLETLEELKVESRQNFLNAGGKDFTYIPCLNDRDSFIRFLADLLPEH